MELLWGVDVVSFGIEWLDDEAAAGDVQVNIVMIQLSPFRRGLNIKFVKKMKCIWKAKKQRLCDSEYFSNIAFFNQWKKTKKCSIGS